MIQQPEQQMTNKINVLIFGKCESGKTQLLQVLKRENQKLNNQIYEKDLDSEEDEEEARDQFEFDQYSSQVNCCQYVSDKCNIYFEESKTNSDDFLIKTPNFEVLMFLFNAQKGTFENQIDCCFNFNLEAIKLLKQSYKIIFVITNMSSCNWSKERFYYIKDHLQSLIVNLQFIVIPIDSISVTNIFNKECSQWYQGNSLIEEISSIKLNNFQNILRIRVLNISKRHDSAYECKVLSGQLNQIENPLNLNSIMKKTTVQIIRIMDMIDNVQFNITQNDMIQIILNDNTKFQIGDILSLPHYTPCFLSQEILAEITLESQKQSLIITSGCSGFLNFHGIQTPFIVTNVEYINIDGKKQVQEFLKSKQTGGVKLKLPEPFCLEKFNVFFELGHFLILSDDQQTIGTGNVLKVKPL